MQPTIADANVTTTQDGRFAMIGWIYRDGAAGWITGVDVLDLASLEVTSSQKLTLDEPVSIGGLGRVRTAPVASVSADGSTMLLTSSWFADDRNTPDAARRDGPLDRIICRWCVPSEPVGVRTRGRRLHRESRACRVVRRRRYGQRQAHLG